MTKIQPGDKAPQFESVNQDGKTVTLDTYLQQPLLALYFYPHDMTPTCTVQAKNLQENSAKLKKAGVKVVGVSEDDEKKHCKFRDHNNLKFDLIADTDLKVLKAYGVWGPKKFMGRTFDGTHRTTFLIDQEGVVRHVIHPVKSKIHTEQILELIK